MAFNFVSMMPTLTAMWCLFYLVKQEAVALFKMLLLHNFFVQNLDFFNQSSLVSLFSSVFWLLHNKISFQKGELNDCLKGI